MTAAWANPAGMGALVLWSLNIALTRHLSEAHPYGLPGISYTMAGCLLLGVDVVRRSPMPWNSTARRCFWPLCGGAFVAYFLAYTVALSLNPTRSVALPLGMVNYLWPALIIGMAPLFSPCRVNPWALIPGLLLCVTGVGLAFLWKSPPAGIGDVVSGNGAAFVMMMLAAFLWAFYSNAARLWGGNANGVGWFLLAAGLAFLSLWFVSGELMALNVPVLFPLALHAMLVNAAAYLLWDIGVRRGDIVLLGALSNFLPLASILFGGWYLGSGTGLGLVAGCLLVITGAVLCRRGVRAR